MYYGLARVFGAIVSCSLLTLCLPAASRGAATTQPAKSPATQPATQPAEPSVIALSAAVQELTLKPGQLHSIQLIASFSQGPRKTVTALAAFKSQDPAVASVDNAGIIKAHRCGQTHVVASFRGRAALVRVTIPQPLPTPFPTVKPNTRIDELWLAKLQELGIPPSDLCSDAVFLRRVHLDTIGILPTPDEARAFLGDNAPDKRSRLIDRLLNRPEFADYWALKWGDLLRIKSEYPVKLWPKAAHAYYQYVHESIAANKPYDQFVTELLISSGSSFRNGPANFYRANASKDPLSFAETTSLLFMGVRLSCARCHQHPVENWKLEDNLGMAAFFGKMKFKSTTEWKEEIVFVDPEAVFKHPKTKLPVKPKFLDGTTPAIAPAEDPREQFAAWLTAPQNPYFARNISNRIWFWLFGRGFVNEPDDLRPTNPPSNPQLLDHLAKELVDHKYDLKHLYRIILNSRTYQLAGGSNRSNEFDDTFFSHYYPKRLAAEQLLDAISQVTETAETFSSIIPEPYTRLLDFHAISLWDGSVGSAFLELFGRPPRDTPFELERCSRPSMRQALHLLNSSDIERKVTSSGRIKRLMQENKTDGQIIDELYLASFSRLPTDEQKQKLTDLLKTQKPRAQAIQDLLWAILNTKEFLFNH